MCWRHCAGYTFRPRRFEAQFGYVTLLSWLHPAHRVSLLNIIVYTPEGRRSRGARGANIAILPLKFDRIQGVASTGKGHGYN